MRKERAVTCGCLEEKYIHQLRLRQFFVTLQVDDVESMGLLGIEFCDSDGDWRLEMLRKSSL